MSAMPIMPTAPMRTGVALCVVALASACATTVPTTQSAAEPVIAEAVVVQPVVTDRLLAEPLAAESPAADGEGTLARSPSASTGRLAQSAPPAGSAREAGRANIATQSSPATQGAGPEAAAGSLADRVAEAGGMAAGIVGGLAMASKLDMLGAQYLAGALVAYSIYDPLAPTWRIDVSRAGGERVRMDLRMRSLITGGEGEARLVFLRSARRMVEAGGFAGFDVIRYEEGMESTRPFARRVASGEIRLVRSRQFPEL